MIGGCTEDEAMNWGENVKILSCRPLTALVSTSINLQLVCWASVFKQTFNSAAGEHVIHLCYKPDTPFWLQRTIPLPLHDSLVTTGLRRVHKWGKLTGKKRRFTNNQSKGQDRAATWPYCSPIKPPRVLTDVKVKGRSVGCLLIGEKVSRDSSVGVCCTFHLHRR